MSLLAALALTTPAYAWKHNGYVWFPEDMPVPWYMDDDLEDSLPDDYRLEVITEGFDDWYRNAECAHMSAEYQGTMDIGVRSTGDRVNGFYWDDPDDSVDPGILGVTTFVGTGRVRTINGSSYTEFLDADITFNDEVDWGTSDEIAADCGGRMAIEGVATHEIGHWFGMNHSCDDGEVCTDQLKRDATMYWSVGPCDLSQNDINQDDIDGITALYGPYGTFGVRSGYRRSGAAPFDFCMDITSEQDVLSVDINWGDGSDHGTDAANPCHTYDHAGQFTVTVTMELADEVCGSYESTASELAYVLACEAPKPEEGADGFFTMEPSDGLTWQTVNHTDVSVYGCVDTIEWQVYKGKSDADITPDNLVDMNGEDHEGAGIGAWSPKITFPEAGDYVVVLNVGGPGGLQAGWVAVTAEESKSETGGCSTTPGVVSGLGALVAAVAAARRRRA